MTSLHSRGLRGLDSSNDIDSRCTSESPAPWSSYLVVSREVPTQLAVFVFVSSFIHRTTVCQRLGVVHLMSERYRLRNRTVYVPESISSKSDSSESTESYESFPMANQNVGNALPEPEQPQPFVPNVSPKAENESNEEYTQRLMGAFGQLIIMLMNQQPIQVQVGKQYTRRPTSPKQYCPLQSLRR